MRLWDLPGAKRFMDSLCGSIRDGNSVVVHLPDELPVGFDTVVRSGLRGALRVSEFRATSAPLRDLSREYAESPDRIGSVPDLCGDKGFQGRLVRLRGLRADSWPVWRDFLARYAHASRSLSLLGRTLFLAPVSGCCSLEEARPAHVGLSVRVWDRVVDEVDLLLFAREQLRERVDSPLLRALLANTVARVASWDFETAAALVAEGDATISAPEECLRGMACAKGWTVDTPVEWVLGTGSRDGVAHAALTALGDPPAELDRRLWSAQLAVLLPWVEERRYELVTRHRYEVTRLMRDAGYAGDDPVALEVGDLRALFGRPGADRDVRRSVGRLRAARNDLAHRRRMSWDRVLELVSEGPGASPRLGRRW